MLIRLPTQHRKEIIINLVLFGRMNRFNILLLLTLSIAILFSPKIVLANNLDNKNKILFEIPQQRADQALMKFAEQANLTFIFSFDEAEKETANNLVGYFTQEKALTVLLKGTGLDHKLRANGSLAIVRNNKPREEEMNKPMKKSKISTAIVSALIAIFGTSTAYGEVAPTDEKENKMTVIGSHIKRATDISTLPVTVMSAEDIANTAAITGDDLIRSIPQMGSINFGETTGSANVNGARGDVGGVNLRGLGPSNTLVLLNGRRLVNHPGTQSAKFGGRVPVTTVNSNTLPVSGLRSLEVLRDGAAAIYGSDAIAGVVNYALDDDYVGHKVSLKYGQSEGTPLNETTFSYLGGLEFNDGRTNLTGSLTAYKRNGMMATERPYSASHDRRNYPGLPADFVGDTQLDNRSSDTPWGEFESASLGRFHLQPDTFAGCVGSPLNVAGVCVDQGSLGRDSRFDRGTTRPLSSDVDRVNLYAHLTHEINYDLNFFSEAIYYTAELSNTSEQNHGGSAHRFIVSADAFYNPFGEDVTVRRYRPVNIGPRQVNVEDTSFRVLAGLEGFVGDWEWESAAFYSEAETDDSGERVDVNAFVAAVNSTTQNGAYNIFAGGDVNNPNTIGNIPILPTSQTDAFTAVQHRISKTSLASVDFKASNSELFSVPAGNAGLAVGVEYRHESFEDDRDPLQDGTFPFVDASGVTNLSSLYGSSATRDSKADRDVYSAYAEMLIPLINSDSQYAEVQLAARYENYSDAGDALKPKVALFWEVAEWVSFRASYAGGFRAPGLQQTTEDVLPRRFSVSDPLNDNDSFEIIENRSGNGNLVPEDDTNISWGVVLEPSDNITFTFDSWTIEQEDLVSLVATSTLVNLDYISRVDGGSGFPGVNRDADGVLLSIDNKYQNADKQELEGFDIGLIIDFETDFGKFEFTTNASKLTKYDVSIDALSAQSIAAQATGNYPNLSSTTPSGVGDQIMRNGSPEWKGRASINWKLNEWGAGIAAKYVSEFFDTSTYYDNDADERIFLPVDSFTTVDVYASYKFADSSSLDGMKVRLGARNIGDKEPPLTDDFWHGYAGDYHSNRGRYVYLSMSKEF
ncbi:MAG: iron complex outermembrane receptor protein [Polaribacter sp.]|jgi:iron complex outermembrane receptor protein